MKKLRPEMDNLIHHEAAGPNHEADETNHEVAAIKANPS
jgi:hypothetical protein